MLAVAAKARTYPVLLPDRAAPPRPRPARRRGRASPLTRVLIAAAVLVVPALVHVGQSTALARTGYAILTLRQEIESLQAENARLVVAVTALKSPERIERVATARLGMVKPHPRQMAALTLPPLAVAAQPDLPPTMWQRLEALLLGHEAAASESH